ncbi:tripartite tricarboxylate transporter substrate binding protein [Oceanobacillus jeddahense]|uniref:Tripartite tricarboxylate transporter substrate binding protein n=1 Tax=Oceanobacillus jeddahense TaxID=1462527 RepID=A0ABY5JSD8_9BACI|nr:tripartite tricarboxylate transporter substrate binding protein [Oceanobacillus jeddahense]UUI03031.1 tripartite tricarboxylate transporter substrate binding protein [Oceanobacillus jeddahense]
MYKNVKFVWVLIFSAIILSACNLNGSSEQDDNANFPSEDITFIVPYPPGGGTDLTARILQPYLEEELGVSVTIQNRDGGGGWVGWSELANAEPDGYTIGYMNMPNVILGYLDPQANRSEDLDSFDFIINHMSDPGVILTNPDYNDFEDVNEFIEHAQENEVTLATGGSGTSQHFLGLLLNEQLGTNFTFVHQDGGGEFIPSLLGGHIDTAFGGLQDGLSPINSGELEGLALFGDEGSEVFSDVPLLNEEVGSDTSPMITRSIATPAGVDPEVREALEEALERAINNPDHIEELKEFGLDIDPISGDELDQMNKDLEEEIINLEDALGW